MDDGGMVAVCLEVGVGGGDKDDFLVGFAVAALFPLLAPAEDFFLGADATPSPAKNSSLSLFAFDDVLPFVLPDALRFSLFAFVSRSFSFLASCVCVCVCGDRSGGQRIDFACVLFSQTQTIITRETETETHFFCVCSNGSN